jgi:hypothetical protein
MLVGSRPCEDSKVYAVWMLDFELEKLESCFSKGVIPPNYVAVKFTFVWPPNYEAAISISLRIFSPPVKKFCGVYADILLFSFGA